MKIKTSARDSVSNDTKPKKRGCDPAQGGSNVAQEPRGIFSFWKLEAYDPYPWKGKQGGVLSMERAFRIEGAGWDKMRTWVRLVSAARSCSTSLIQGRTLTGSPTDQCPEGIRSIYGGFAVTLNHHTSNTDSDPKRSSFF